MFDSSNSSEASSGSSQAFGSRSHLHFKKTLKIPKCFCVYMGYNYRYLLHLKLQLIFDIMISIIIKILFLNPNSKCITYEHIFIKVYFTEK